MRKNRRWRRAKEKEGVKEKARGEKSRKLSVLKPLGCWKREVGRGRERKMTRRREKMKDGERPPHVCQE